MKQQTVKRKSQAGFTLIEILVVMVIMAALVVIAASSFQSVQLKSRDARRKSDLKEIANGLETFYADNGYYPASSSYRIVGCGTSSNKTACDPGEEFSLTNSAGGKTTYMVQLPDDPRDGEYIYLSDGASYQLYARLENHRDTQVKNPSDTNPDTDGDGDTYLDGLCRDELGCNFGVSSTNISINEPLGGAGSDPGGEIGVDEL